MELALILPLVFVLLLTIVQVGLLIRDQVMLTHAAREAARVVAVTGDGSAAAGAAGEAAQLETGRLRTGVSGGTSQGDHVTITLDYTATTDVPIIGPLLGDLQLQAKATMRVE